MMSQNNNKTKLTGAKIRNDKKSVKLDRKTTNNNQSSIMMCSVPKRRRNHDNSRFKRYTVQFEKIVQMYIIF